MPSPSKKHKKRERTADPEPDETPPEPEETVNTASPEMSQTDKKKKKRKDRKRSAADLPEDGGGDATKKMRREKNGEPGERTDDEASEPGKQDGSTWSDEDLQQLVSNITKSLPKNDSSTFRTTLKSFKWDTAVFGEYTAEQCQQEWAKVLQTVRKQRSLTEIVHDVQDQLQKGTLFQGKKTKPIRHPDQPKKPMTAFFLFFNKRRKKLQQQHPNMKVTELSKLAAQMYKDLPKEKQKKYQEDFEAQKEKYKADMEQFRADHPGEESIFSMPPPKTAQQIFLDTKIAEQLESDPTADAKDLKDQYRKKWGDLSEKKKVKFIKKAKKEEESYAEYYETFCKAHPQQNLAAKSRRSLTKKERLMLDRVEGRPARPPTNGFKLFTIRMLQQLKEVPANQRMSVIPGRWKALSEAQKANYNDDVAKQWEDYQEAWKKYLEGLSPERRTQVEKESQKTHKKREPQKRERVSAKSITPLSMYMEEKQEFLRLIDSNATDKKLKNMATKFFKALDPSLKAKYEELAEEKRRSLGLVLWPGEPKRPAGSGYQLFCGETLLERKMKLNEIAGKWRALSPKHQQKYIARQKKLVAEYEQNLEKFLAGLSVEDRQRYDEQHKRKKTSSTSGKSDIEKAEESSANSESESGSSSESEEETPVQKRSPFKKGQVPKVASPPKKTVNKKTASSSEESESESESESEDEKPVQRKSPVKKKQTLKVTSPPKKTVKRKASSSSSGSSSSSSSDSEAEEETPPRASSSSSKSKQAKSPQKSPPSKPTKAAPQPTRKSATSDSSSSSSESESESEPVAKLKNTSFQSPPPTQRLMNIAQAAMNYKPDSSSSSDDSDSD